MGLAEWCRATCRKRSGPAGQGSRTCRSGQAGRDRRAALECGRGQAHGGGRLGDHGGDPALLGGPGPLAGVAASPVAPSRANSFERIDRFPSIRGMLGRSRPGSKFREVRADRALPAQASLSAALLRFPFPLPLVLVLPGGRGRGVGGSNPRSRMPRSISAMAVSTTLTRA
jgi:hypothetical protein